MRFPRAVEKYKEPITGFAGAGTGLFTGELVGETAARISGQTGINKAGVKTIVKGGIGLLALLLGGGRRGMSQLFLQVFAYTNWGSILLDWLFAYYPGGVFGMAERLAVSVRVWSVGAQKVSAEMAALQRAGATPMPTTGTAKITSY